MGCCLLKYALRVLPAPNTNWDFLVTLIYWENLATAILDMAVTVATVPIYLLCPNPCWTVLLYTGMTMPDQPDLSSYDVVGCCHQCACRADDRCNCTLGYHLYLHGSIKCNGTIARRLLFFVAAMIILIMSLYVAHPIGHLLCHLTVRMLGPMLTALARQA